MANYTSYLLYIFFILLGMMTINIFVIVQEHEHVRKYKFLEKQNRLLQRQLYNCLSEPEVEFATDPVIELPKWS